jgi:hypothetical protein
VSNIPRQCGLLSNDEITTTENYTASQLKAKQNIKTYLKRVFVYCLKTIATEDAELIQNLNLNNYEIKHVEKYLLFSNKLL